MSPELEDYTNHCRRLLLARRHKFELGGKHFSLTERVIGTRTGSKVTTPVASSKTTVLQKSRKPGNNGPASKENKQFDPREKGGEPPL